MNLQAFLPLLAQVSREDFGRGFRGATSQLSWLDFVPYIAVAAVIGAAWGATSYVKKRNDMSSRCNDPRKLFRELCLAHQLDRRSQRLLLELAEAFRLAQPAQVFLTPSAFDAARMPASLRGRAPEIALLRERLF
ncbi:MAG TPA: hypothetical protein VEQ85_04345 [Lacipirellulaceae bacterium]|nr:hypothetical protein [Lacipirellulaceae bacterium]